MTPTCYNARVLKNTRCQKVFCGASHRLQSLVMEASTTLQEDGTGGLCTGSNSDSEDGGKKVSNTFACTGGDNITAKENFWPHQSSKEHQLSVSTGNLDGCCHSSCTQLEYSIWPAEGSSEKESWEDSTGEVYDIDCALTSLPPDDQILSDSKEIPSFTAEPNMEMRTINYGERRGSDKTELCSVGGMHACKSSNKPTLVNRPGEAWYLYHVLNKVVSLTELKAYDTETEVDDRDKDQSVDRKPLDFYTAREQWVKLDTASSKPPQPLVSTLSFKGHITNTNLAAGLQVSLLSGHREGLLSSDAVTHDIHQRELLCHLSLSKQRPKAQQVFEGSPPLATVAQEPANQQTGCHGFSSVVVKELFSGAEGCGKGEREEEESRQADIGKHQKSAGLHVGRPETAQLQKADKANPEQGCRVKERHSLKLTARKGRSVRMEGEGSDDSQSDSGVSGDFSPGSTMDLNPASLASDDLGSLSSPPKETPIEREIRRTAEREQSLRRSRGLAKTQEFVDIPLRRPVLSQPLPGKLSKSQGKERRFAGKKMQREITMENQREQLLVELGKVPGVYDKGSIRQIRERKQLFEVFQESQAMTVAPSKRPVPSGSELLTRDQGDEALATGSVPDGGHSVDLLAEDQSTLPVPCGPTLSEGSYKQVIILESGSVLRTSIKTQHIPPTASPGVESMTRAYEVTVVDLGLAIPTGGSKGQDTKQDIAGEGNKEDDDDDEMESALARENPFFKLRSSMSLKPEVEQDIREARERERELRKQRTSLYGVAKGGRPVSSEMRSTSALGNCLDTTNQPSKLMLSTPSVRLPSGKLDLVWPPPQADAEKTGQAEIPRSPRTARQKLPLLHRWEAGMVNGSEEVRN